MAGRAGCGGGRKICGCFFSGFLVFVPNQHGAFPIESNYQSVAFKHQGLLDKKPSRALLCRIACSKHLTLNLCIPNAQNIDEHEDLERHEKCRAEHCRLCIQFQKLLASLAIRVVDRAELHVGGGQLLFYRRSCRRSRRRCQATCRTRRDRIQLTRLDRALLGVSRTHGAEVVGRLQTTQPSELVGFIELLARGASHIDVQGLGPGRSTSGDVRRLPPATASPPRRRWRTAPSTRPARGQCDAANHRSASGP